MWFVIALIVAAVVAILLYWLRSHDIKIKWYEWLIGAIGIILLLLTVQHYVGSQLEGYPTAGWLGLVILGIPALILLTIVWLLAWRRNRAT